MMKLDKISMEQALLEVGKEALESPKYINQFKTLSAITKDHQELFKFYGVKYFKRLAEEGIIVKKSENSKSLYSLQSIDSYNYYYQQFKEEYLNLTEVIKVLGYQKKNTYPYLLIERFIYMKNKGYLNVILLDHIIEFNEYFVSRKELEHFRNHYISYPEAATEANVSIASIKFWMKDYKCAIIYLNKKNVNFFYLKRNEWNEFFQYRKKVDFISVSGAADMLEISPISLEKVAEEYRINYTEVNQHNFFKKNDVEFLKKKQDELWNKTLETYYIREEASKRLGIANKTLSHNPYQDNIKSIFVPPLICTFKDGISFRNGREKIFLKKDVDSFIINRQPTKVVNHLISTMETDSYTTVLTMLKETNINFSENGKATEEYWNKYLKKKSISTNASSTTKRKDIRVNFNTSKLLIELTNTKEVYAYSTNELKFTIFNTDIPTTTKLETYKFLKVVAESRIALMEPINYKVDSLPNLYIKKGNKTNDKSIYPIDQFIKLIDYAIDVSKHKSKAINNIILCKNNQVQNHYDSSWLYVILHLNNAWRHNDVTMFPRINLDRIRIGNLEPEKALEWLNHNNLNENEKNQIMNQVSAIKFIHSKTKKRRYFFCSEELKNAFVHSVILCELRCRISNPLSSVLIDFDNRARTFKEIFKKNFFADFNSDFNFKSKQMNRTLISYIYSVIKKTTNRNPLEVTKYIRSHSSIETTNIYIDIPQEQMDFITSQLFSLGHFGYAYDALGELLLDNSSSEREVKTKQSLMIKEVFGNVHQIEHLANYLKRLTEDQNSVRKVLQGYSTEERETLSNLVKLGQQPAKKEGFQCIYNKCPYPSRDCEKCPFVISHFYALSQLGEDFENQLNEFKTNFPTTTKDGEKIRLSNNLYSYINLISSAVKQFGEDNVASFFSQELKDIKLELDKIPSVKHLVTISKSRKVDEN